MSLECSVCERHVSACECSGATIAIEAANRVLDAARGRSTPPAESKCERCGHDKRTHLNNRCHYWFENHDSCNCDGYRPPTTEPAESEGKWKPTEEMIARDIAFHGECFAVDYGNAHDYDDAFAEKMRDREKWYKAGWQGRKRYEAEQGGNDEQD